jgi:nucleoid DNA-binding protein
MDKPVTTPLKDFLIRKLAVKLMKSEQIISEVVAHQFKTANEAMLTNDSIEISGFGKFYFNHKKAKTALANYSSSIESIEKKLATIAEGDMKNKLLMKKKVMETLKNNIALKICL